MRTVVGRWGIGLLAPATAFAWGPGEVVQWSGPEGPRALAAGTWADGPVVVVAADEGVFLLDPAGEQVAHLEGPRHDVLLRDLDQDGSAEILLCGPAGIELVRGTAAKGLQTVPLTDVACDALRAYEVGAFSALVTGSGSDATTWLPEGGAVTATPLATVGGPALVATDGKRVAAAGAGATTLFRLGQSEIELDGPILDLAASPGGWWVVMGTDGSQVVEVGGEGRTLTVSPPPSGIRSVRLVDGQPALAVLDPVERRIGLLDGGGRLGWVTVPVEPHLVTAADLGADGCADLVVVGRDGAVAVLAGDCSAGLPVATVVGDAGGWGALAVPAAGPAPVPEPVPEPRPVPRVSVPDLPDALLLDDVWPDLHWVVGQQGEVRLGDSRRPGSRTFRSRGGPPGFAATSDGTLDFRPELDDVGVWRVSVQMKGGGGPARWNGFVLYVHPDPNGTGDAPGDEVTVAASGADIDRDDDEDDGPVVAVRARPTGSREPFEGFRECQLGVGGAGGAAKAGAPTWEELGQADVRGGASPIVALQCLGRIKGKTGWFVGLDTAPFFEYASLPRDRTHVLATILGVDFGSARYNAGLYGTYGLGMRPSPGLRAQLRPLGRDDRPMGLELRATWLAPQLGAEVAGLWLFRL